MWPEWNIKSPEKEVSEMEITNLSDAELKTLVIRMLKENDWVWPQNNEEVKAIRSNKEKYQGTNSEEKEAGFQINDLEQKEVNIQLEQKEEIRILKNEERLSNLWDNFKHTNIWILGVPEEEEKQEIESLFEKVMK